MAPTLHAYAQAREDLARWTEGLTDAEIWLRPQGLAPVGFQLRHIAGSVQRLTTYLRGEQLTPEQLEAIHREMDPGPGRSGSLQELLIEVNEALRLSEQVIRALDPSAAHGASKRGPKTFIDYSGWIGGTLGGTYSTPCG